MGGSGNNSRNDVIRPLQQALRVLRSLSGIVFGPASEPDVVDHSESKRGLSFHRAGCHCGNLTARLALTRAPLAYVVRKCTCSFCLAHGACYVSDNNGRLEISVGRGSHLGRYKFGTHTSESLFCTRCGVLLAVIAGVHDGIRGALNIKSLVDSTAFRLKVDHVDYDDEPVEARLIRRAAVWTPASIKVGRW